MKSMIYGTIIIGFYLLARMEYKKGDYVFIELEAGCTTNYNRWTGNIFVTRFSFVVFSLELFTYFPCDVETSIYQSLRDAWVTPVMLSKNSRQTDGTWPKICNVLEWASDAQISLLWYSLQKITPATETLFASTAKNFEKFSIINSRCGLRLR